MLWLCAFPSKCRGGCAIGFVALPISVEVIVVGLALCLIPLSEEVIVVWLSALSLLCEVIVVVPCLLCRGYFVGERSCVLLFCNCKFSVEGSYVGGPVWTYSENPSV